MIPEYWKAFITQNELVGEYFEIPESADLSELDGGNLKLLSDNQIIDETNEFYPGIAVKKFGFIPVGSCSLGSGDPYFININDGVNGKLYRVYHDAEMVDEESYNMDEAVNIVLADYTELLKYVCKSGN